MNTDRVFLTGGARSGKSQAAERLIGSAAAVTYVATGPGADADDPEWAARVRRHQARRPAHWITRETTDLVPLIATAGAQTPVLVDCLTLWLTARLDRWGAWDGSVNPFDEDALAAEVDALVAAIDGSPGGLVLVSNEVGSGIVPADPGTRMFRDWLGIVNARVAAACDRAYLIVAGQALPLQPLVGGGS